MLQMSSTLSLLHERGVDTLLLTGCWTESCILSTAVRAVNEDFNACVVDDALFSGVAAAAGAHEVLHSYALVASAAEVEAYLEGRVHF